MIRFIIAAMLVSAVGWALPASIESAIRQSGIPKSDISIYIKEAGSSDRVIASLNAQTTRTPASVIKVMTLYAAVLKLGFDYRWPTQFYVNGRIVNGTLQGDLIVKGFGDPTLDSSDLDAIVSQIKQKGIRRITGNIVIDRSYFQVGTKNSSKFDENPYSPYNAMPDAMMFNERVSTICVEPKKNSVSKKTPDKSYIIHNQLKRVNKPCRGRYAWPHIKIDDSKAVPEVWLKGKISKRCRRRDLCQVITKPYLSFYYALSAAMKEAGIAVSGTMRLRKVPNSAKLLFTYYAVPFERIVAKTAKKSNNLYARHILLLLGAKEFGAPATLEKGRRAVRKILAAHGALGRGMLHIDNGCGLSRSARLNAALLATLLDNAYMRYGMRWMQTLSIAGVDGTIKRRFRGTAARKRAWMKTGTLKHAKNIAGYVKSRNGRYYTTVILVNTKKGRWKAAKLEDTIILWLVGYKGRGARKALSVPKPLALPQDYRTEEITDTDVPKPFYVQAGSFKHYPKHDYLQKIEKEKFPYKVIPGKEFKVIIGPFATEKKTRQVLKRVRKHISSGAFLTTKAKLNTEGVRLY
jgi:D-alanyl-D-alanine carboxypeptidase/D-alanyl-D-alanine-endopeptidase (penicillin-binding protein 4)